MDVVYARLSLVLHTQTGELVALKKIPLRKLGRNTKLSFEVCAAYRSTTIQWVISGIDREMKALHHRKC